MGHILNRGMSNVLHGDPLARRLCFLLAGLSVCSITGRAQSDTAFTVSGHVEVYYCYDLAAPTDGQRENFFYNYDRHNEMNLNLGYVKLAYADSSLRGNFALMAGTYPQANLNGEPVLLRNVFEANIGARLSRSRALWLDAGIMPGHIGFESAVGQDGWNLTRSLVAENSPYYEAGARLSYTSPDEQWYAAVLWLNGWQAMQRNGSVTLSGGTQLTWKPDTRTVLNWSTYVGDGASATPGDLRLFNNLYAQLRKDRVLALTIGFDSGWQIEGEADTVRSWFSPVVIPRLRLDAKRYLAVRIEYYADRDEVIIASGAPEGFQTLGLSLNYDHWFRPNVLWRVECRSLQSQDPIFIARGEPARANTFFTASLSIML